MLINLQWYDTVMQHDKKVLLSKVYISLLLYYRMFADPQNCHASVKMLLNACIQIITSLQR